MFLVNKVKFVDCLILGEIDREKKLRDKQKRSLSALYKISKFCIIEKFEFLKRGIP